MVREPQKKDEDAGYRAADELKRLVHTRTGLTPQQLVCPREKSDMTPCVARDGHLAVTFTSISRFAICVGCEADVDYLLAEELKKAGG